MADEFNYKDVAPENVYDFGLTTTTADPVIDNGMLYYDFAKPETSPVPEKAIDVIARKYSFASGGEISIEDAKLKLQSNNEEQLREWMAYKQELANNRARRALIEETALKTIKTDDKIALLKEVAQLDLTADPKIAYAEEFARKAVSSIPGFMPLPDAAHAPDALDRILDRQERIISKREIFGRLKLDLEEKLNNSSFFGGIGYNLVNATVDTAKLFIPGLSWYRFRELANSQNLETSKWKSDNLENVIEKIYAMPVREGYEKAKEIAEKLIAENSYDALTFINGLEAYGNSDRFLNDVETVLDATVIGSAGLRLVSALRGAHRAFGANRLISSKLPEAAGDLGQAARMAVTEDLIEQASASGSRSSWQRVMDRVPTIFNPDNVLTNSTNLGAEAINRLRQSLNNSTTEILRKIANSVNVQRLDETSAALARGLAEAEQYIRTHYTRLNDAILDIRPVSSDAGLGNLPGVEARIGGSTFEASINAIKKFTAQNPEFFILASQVDAGFAARAVREGFLNEFTRTIPQRLVNGKWVASTEVKGYRLDPSHNLVNPKDLKEGIEVVIGTKNAQLFDTEAQAINNAKNVYALKEGSFSVKPEGNKYYISIFKQVDETTPTVRQALAQELNQPEAPGIWNFIARRIGSTEDLMRNSMSTQRKTALFQAGDLIDTLSRVANDKIGTLRKDSRRNLMRFIDNQRRVDDGQNAGRFSRDIGEFETEWRATFNTRPTEKETDAYFHYVMLSDMDWTINNTNLFTQKAAQGYRSFSLSTDNVKMKDLWLDGKIVDAIPNIERTYPNVIVWSNNISNLRTITNLGEVQNWLDQGYHIIKLSSNSGHDITRFPGIQPHLPKGRIDYVLTRNFDEGPLRWDQLAYRPGGHRVYTDDWYVSAAKVFTGNRTGEVFSAYGGDFNIVSARTRSQAQQMTDVLETARQMLQRNDPGLSDYITNNFPHGLTEARFRSLFTDEVLNINEPFRIRRTNTTIADVYQLDRHYPNFVDQTKSGHHLDEGMVKYSNRRSQMLGNLEGTDETPLVRVGEGRLLDPMQTLSNSVNSIARNLSMENIRIKHSNEYMARFGDLLDIKEPLDATLNPFKYLLDGKFKEGAIDAERLAAAKAYRRSALEFLGIQTETSTATRTFRDRMLDNVFARFGERGADFVEPYLLHRVNDPFKFFRSIAFHKNIGLFNWSSYVTQMMQFTTMAGLAGGQGVSGYARAGQGLAWGIYQRMLPMASEPVRRAIIERAGQWGANFEEATQAWHRSGLSVVGGEVSYLDDFIDQPIMKTGLGEFLDFGRVFFDAGERHARQTAWNIAYLEWRTANPRATLTDSTIRSLIQRTDLLTGNMTRASQSYWQRGALSLPAQFNTWQIRMTEQMFGDRLTRAEKASVLMLNSVLYGIPTGLNTRIGPVGMVPWADAITKQLRDRGVEVRDSAAMDLMFNGIIPQIMEYTTGDRWNIGQKYGPPSKNFIKEALFNDEKSWLAVTAGAAGDTVSNVLKVTNPLIYTLIGLSTGSQNVYPLTVDDFKDRITKLLPTLDMADRALVALATGKYISRNNREKSVADIENYKGLLIGLLGLTPDVAVQTYDKSLYLKNIKDFQDSKIPEIEGALLKALRSNDDTTFHDNMKIVNALLEIAQFTPSERSRVIHRVISNNADLVDQVDRRLAERGLPQLQMYYRELERNKK